MNEKALMRIIKALNQPYKEAFNFQKDVTAAGTPENLSAQSIPCAAVRIKAKRANTGYIYIGFDDQGQLSSSNGTEYEAKDSEVIPIDDVNKIWIDSSVNGEGVEVFIYR
jgi:hypothetical protein